jgi:hypothetical protein
LEGVSLALKYPLPTRFRRKILSEESFQGVAGASQTVSGVFSALKALRTGRETAKTPSFAPIQGVGGAREGLRESLKGQNLPGEACRERFQRQSAVNFLAADVFVG